MGIFSKKSKQIPLGEVNIATPATHITQMDSERSFGTNVLKGYDSGILTFGEVQNLFPMVNSRNEISGLTVKSWGYSYPFLSFPTDNLYILCEGWVAFKIELENCPVWESWLKHNHPN